MEHAKTAIECFFFVGSGLFYWGSCRKFQAVAEIKRELFNAFLEKVSGKANGQAV